MLAAGMLIEHPVVRFYRNIRPVFDRFLYTKSRCQPFWDQQNEVSDCSDGVGDLLLLSPIRTRNAPRRINDKSNNAVCRPRRT